jgi:hypothetical protein
MKYIEIKKLLEDILELETNSLDIPTISEWNYLEKFLNYKFQKEFKYFVELMCDYRFPGDMLNVSKGLTNGNDDIDFIYEYEIENSRWNSEYIPFYSIGNGDYFCFGKIDNNIYYYYSDTEEFEMYLDNFNSWLKDLKDFLS